MPAMKLLIAIVFTAFLTGCAAPIHKHEIADLQKSQSIQVTDTRPKQESEQKLFSALITSDAYGLYRFSTQSLDPSAERIFQHKLLEKFPDVGQAPNVTVFHFVTYWNAQSSFRKTALGAGLGGIIGAAIVGANQNNDADFKTTTVNAAQFNAIGDDDEYTKAFYTPEENPNKAPVFIVYIDAEINGKRSFIKGIAPSTRTDGKHSYLYAVENTIQAFLNGY